MTSGGSFIRIKWVYLEKANIQLQHLVDWITYSYPPRCYNLLKNGDIKPGFRSDIHPYK